MYNTYCSTNFCSNRSIGKEKQQSFDCIKNDERKTWISNRASPLRHAILWIGTASSVMSFFGNSILLDIASMHLV